MPKETIKSVTFDAFGFGTLAEDAIGLNADAFKTILQLFTKPLNYFNAALDKNWNNKFRPSIRIWFALSAITAALQFLWAGKDTPMHTLYSDLMTQIATHLSTIETRTGRILNLENFDPDFAATTLLKWYMIFLPFVMIVFVALFALVFQAWGRKLSYVARVRFIFAILIPSSFFGLVTNVFNKLLDGPFFQAFMNVGLLIMMLLYFVTAYRGAYADIKLSKSGQLGRSTLIAFLLMIVVLIASFLSIIVALYPTFEIAFTPHLDMPITTP